MKTRINCPNCGPVYGTASLFIHYIATVGSEGIERNEFDEPMEMGPRIYLTCYHCLNSGSDEAPTVEDPEHLRDRLYDLLLRDLETQRELTVLSGSHS